jgi:hypothetical protein
MARIASITRTILVALIPVLAGALAAGFAAAQATRPDVPAPVTDVPGLGTNPLGFGVDVTSLKSGLGLTPDRLSAVSFDLKLQWPVATSDEPGDVLRRLAPFVSLGPALIVAPVATDLPPVVAVHPPVDTGLALGVRGGAGVSLQLGKSTSIYGQYGVTRSAGERVPGLGGHPPIDPGVVAHDLLYGLSIRF